MMWRSWATISPWIRKRVETRSRFSNYLVCPGCGTGAFDYRYSREEMELLYREYRGEEYFRIRNSWEPSYSEKLNSDFGEDESVLEFRRGRVREAIRCCMEARVNPIRVAVDIGGDRGQFIPESIVARYVLDASGREPIDGVTSVDSLTEIREEKVDLIMVCGLLEHLPDPLDFLQDLRESLVVAHETLVYVEVPAGVPDPDGSKRGLPTRIVSELACRWKTLWRWLDVRSAEMRIFLGKDHRLMPMRQSEHLNFFTTSGLEQLVARAGARTLMDGEYEMPVELTDTGRVAFSRVLHSVIKFKQDLHDE